MKKIAAVVFLTALSLAVLLGFAEKGEKRDYAYYFRDNTEFAGTQYTICYSGMPYTQARHFEDHEENLIDLDQVPDMKGFDNFYIIGKYQDDGTLFELQFFWQNTEADNYKQLSLLIMPADVTELDRRDGAVEPHETGNTVTEVNGITVTGLGTVALVEELNLRNNCLIFERDGLRYQIDASHKTTLDDMGAVLDFYLQNAIDLSAFAMEKGDKYDHAQRADYPDAFSGCIPDETGTPLEKTQDSLTLKNDSPYSAALIYEYSVENSDQAGVVWYSISSVPETSNLPELSDLTATKILAELKQENQIAFQVEGMQIDVSMNAVDTSDLILMLLSTLTGFPAEESEHDPSYYFRDNTGQAGTFNYAFCGVGKEKYQQRYFIDRWGALLQNDIIPAIPGTALEYLYGYYYPEDELCLVHMEFGDTWVYIYPPGTGTWDSWYEADPEECTETVVNGVKIYGDGLPDAQEKAVFFEMEDGSKVYIVTTQGADAAVMTALAEHFAKYGVALDTFAMENGDHYEYVGLKDPRAAEFLEGCYPDTEDILIVNVEIKNGVIQKAIIGYEVLPGRSLTWKVFPECPLDVEIGLRDIPDLTLEDLEAWLNEADSSAVTYVNGKFIEIHMGDDGLADELWEMISLLQ